jgi:hypothetical protein
MPLSPGHGADTNASPACVRDRGKYNARASHTKALTYAPPEGSRLVVSSFTLKCGERC